MSESAADFIKGFEGFCATPYRDVAGIWTIGYGTTRGVNAATTPVTREQALTLLEEDLAPVESAIEELVEVELTDNQYCALCSFIYNVGIGAFRSSTLLRMLNAGDYDGAADQFLRWNRAGGHVVAGLMNRRNAERDLFLKG